ncbi:NADPH-dependent FMN reductase [Dyadobacter fermentans]|uniref:NADPH-dependent FMN reductase n=1 Tax=Dyadobacter fermentans TaxID=94254 RepID=UPI001CBA8FD4|nr:NAD(P)H-dependent oxidoreductase [Dyadobacter fermentans]MBZ1358245.1 NAD(P)H-dependent oxidoreductase [Dyadobacter fermentans]
MKHIHILGISGSLRADSTNTIILKTLGSTLPSDITFEIFEGLDEIVHFSPGLPDTEPVTRFKAAIAKADAVVFCTPEYAFGVPGTLKNALDWTVGTGDLNDKPVSAISASPLNSGGNNALASLLLTLTALGMKKNDASALSIPNVKGKITEGRVIDAHTLNELRIQCANLLSLIGS